MRAPMKVGLIAAGYLGAALVAGGVVAIRVAATSGPDSQAYSRMYAFGDTLLFLAVFGACALVPTAAVAALWFPDLRPRTLTFEERDGRHRLAA